MQCTEAKIQLEHAIYANDPFAGELVEHLAGCERCHEYAENIRLQCLLGPVPPLSPTFAEQALDKAWAAREERQSPQRTVVSPMWVATAASLLLAVGLVFTLSWRGGEMPVDGSPLQVVQVTPQSVRQVELLMVSEKALPDAFITVQLDGNVGLAGHPGTTQVRWRSPISAGNNQLSLPVELLSDGGGFIVVKVESGGKHKQLRFSVEPASNKKPNTQSI